MDMVPGEWQKVSVSERGTTSPVYFYCFRFYFKSMTHFKFLFILGGKVDFIPCVYAVAIDHLLKKNFLSPLNCLVTFV